MKTNLDPKLVEVESQLWFLDKMYAKRGIDISGWTTFHVCQFASAYAHYKLYAYLQDNPQAFPQLLELVRLANLTKAQLLERLPGEKKSLKRVVLYKIARAQLLAEQKAKNVTLPA